MTLPEKNTELLTYSDYLAFPEDERREIIGGVVYAMGPAPSNRHQKIIWELVRQIAGFLADKPCEGRTAPFDVRFPEGVEENDKIVDVVQPDISIICDLSKLDERGCLGAPDFIVEIVSISSITKDFIVKTRLYEQNGVREYWIFDPFSDSVTVNILGDDLKFTTSIHRRKGKLEVSVLRGLEIDLCAVFGNIPEAPE